MDIFHNVENDELPPLYYSDDEDDENDQNESNSINHETIIYPARIIAMPSECTTNPLQRALADSIIRMVSLDELRILLACGAKVSF
jgi:hypothetical protein